MGSMQLVYTIIKRPLLGCIVVRGMNSIIDEINNITR